MIAATAALAACASAATISVAARDASPSGSPAAAVVGDLDGLGGAGDPGEAARRAGRPNVVMITLDDLAEGDLQAMPQTRRLLEDQGTTLTQGLAPTPICAPARASLLTGQYAHNHHVVTVEGPAGGFDHFNDKRTLPTWLRAAGYDTMFAGKYLNGYGVRNPRYVPPGWNHWRGSVDWTTYSFFSTRFNVDGTVVQPKGYSSDILGRYTTEMLDQHRRGKASSKPFFMWVNYVAPHHGGPRESDDPQVHWREGSVETTTPAPRDRNSYRNKDLPRVPSMWEKDVRGNPHAGSPNTSAGYRAAVRESYQQRLESVKAVDRAVARTIGSLRKHGELRNTVVLLTSDNGFLTGQHNRTGKLWFYDDSLRIPMIVRGPGVPRGRTLSAPITNPDLAVTIAALAKARPTRTVDGVDVWPWITRSETAPRDRVIPIEGYQLAGRKRLYAGLRYGDYTYVRSPNGYEELYDRSTDPWELTNVAKRPAYRDVMTKLRAWERTYRGCAGAVCRRLP